MTWRQLGVLGLSPDQIRQGYMPAGAQLNDRIDSVLSPVQGKLAFGIAPPDLSAEAGRKGEAWLSVFLNGFYPDPVRPSGWNNRVVKNVAMPNVLAGTAPDHQAAARQVADLSRYLAFVADPAQPVRRMVGLWVLLFLAGLLLPLVYCLKKEIWRDV